MPKCSWCGCPEEEHSEYRECLLFDGSPICDICCDYDIISCNPETDQLEIIEAIKKVTGKTMTEEQVAETCARCRKSVSFSFFNRIEEGEIDK